MKRFIANLFLWINGWTHVGQAPDEPRYVLLAVPHTSNWDLIYLLAFAWAHDIGISWMGKHSIFKGPTGPLMRKLGGVPVRRDRRNDLVAQMAAAFEERDRLVLVVPPEGTRSRAEHWKSGFYRIAMAAKVPVVPSLLDYGRKRGGFGDPIELSGDVVRDMDVFRAFYDGVQGKYPEEFGPIRLAEESEPARIVAG